MDPFLLTMRRLQFFVFSILAGLLLLTTYFTAKWHDSGPTTMLAFILIIVGACFVAYLYIVYFSKLSQRAKYLVKVTPVLLICLGFSALVIAGFIQYLRVTEAPLRFTAPDNPVSLSYYAKYMVFSLLLGVLLMPLITFFAARSIMRTMRVRHHVDATRVRFFNRAREWEVDLSKVRSLVLGETNIVACKDDEDEETALDLLNRPHELSFTSRPLEGVLYLDNDLLIRDARAAGLEVEEKGLATIIKASS